MHTAASVVLLTAALVLAELVRGAPPTIGAWLFALLATIAALVASRVSPLAIASGGIAALAWIVLRPIAAPIAGAGFVLLVLAARALRVASGPSRILHTALCIGSGGVAAWASEHWVRLGALDDLVRPVAAMVIAALALGLPFLVPSDDPQTHALLSLARRTRGGARPRLLRAVVLRRRALGVSGHGRLALRSAEQRALSRAFDELEEVAADLIDRGASLGVLTESLERRVRALGRAVRALVHVDEEEGRLSARSAGDADLAAEHAEARREALRALM